jgi:hypothetical protein
LATVKRAQIAKPGNAQNFGRTVESCANQDIVIGEVRVMWSFEKSPEKTKK